MKKLFVIYLLLAIASATLLGCAPAKGPAQGAAPTAPVASPTPAPIIYEYTFQFWGAGNPIGGQVRANYADPDSHDLNMNLWVVVDGGTSTIFGRNVQVSLSNRGTTNVRVDVFKTAPPYAGNTFVESITLVPFVGPQYYY